MARTPQQPRPKVLTVTPPPVRPDPAQATVLCPACRTVHAARAAHECDPVALWQQTVARWNDLSRDDQRERIAECREIGHDNRPVPRPGLVMCWRCCAYNVVQEGA